MTYDIIDIKRNAMDEVWSQFGGWYLQWLNIVVSADWSSPVISEIFYSLKAVHTCYPLSQNYSIECLPLF